MPEAVPIVTLSGSTAQLSRSAALAAHAGERLRKQGAAIRSLIVREMPAEDILHGRAESQVIQAAARLLDSAQGVVIVTPVYKGAAAGILKAFLDLMPQGLLQGKVVLPIAVGGSPAHMLAIDYSLRPVLAVLGATRVQQTVYAVDKQVRVNPHGGLDLDDELALRLEEGLQSFARAAEADAPMPRHRQARAVPVRQAVA